jgi:polysaccharide chain length determinant protein (PEP-CTERM system associated)
MGTAPVPLTELVPVLIGEARRRRLMLGTLFAVIALAAVGVGAAWPKKYTASTTILVQESNIVTGLMQGRAIATGVVDRAGLAREVVFSRKVMDQILDAGGWTAREPRLTPLQRDHVIEEISQRTGVSSPRDNLIQITYSDRDPKRAYILTREFADLFIRESLAAKERESRNAFEFIDDQVQAYHAKLADAEAKLKAFRETHVDARPGSEADSNARIAQLRSELEKARLDLMELHSSQSSLASQVSGESEINAVQTRAGQYRMQLAELQSQLDKLLLTYTDQYPDVIRVRHQMEDVKQLLAQAESGNAADGGKAAHPRAMADYDVQYNPVYQQLRGKLADTRRASAATSSRLSMTQGMLNAELDRSKRIADSENALAELTRDYEVNRDIYQDLLKRRENARVSMNLDEKRQGLTFRIQEPAVMPLRPSGLRMMHFAAAGLAFGFALPLGVLFGYARLDPRLRTAGQLERQTGIPVLATVPFYPTWRDRRRARFSGILVTGLVAAVLLAYVLIAWFRMELL